MDTGWLVAKYVNPEVTEAFEVLDRQALTESLLFDAKGEKDGE